MGGVTCLALYSMCLHLYTYLYTYLLHLHMSEHMPVHMSIALYNKFFTHVCTRVCTHVRAHVYTHCRSIPSMVEATRLRDISLMRYLLCTTGMATPQHRAHFFFSLKTAANSETADGCVDYNVPTNV